MEELYIDFYRGKDEQAFIDAWQKKHGNLSEEETDQLYAEIADAVHAAVQDGSHEVGTVFVFKGVRVGKTDYNAFHALYLFEEVKD